MQEVYENKEFIILRGNSSHGYSYVLYNKEKPFKIGHTHINNYNTTRWIMKIYQQRKLPDKIKSLYLLKSLLRISNDEKYSVKVQQTVNKLACCKRIAK